MAAIRLGSWESARAFKGIICDDISEFESHMPSHAVRSLWLIYGTSKNARHPTRKNEITIFVFSITAKDFPHGVLLDGKGTIRRSRRAPVRGRSAASARPAARAPRATTRLRRRRAA